MPRTTPDRPVQARLAVAALFFVNITTPPAG